ncbi:type-1 angiotensin II receptor-associated protein-like [Glandiceps talaboti]
MAKCSAPLWPFILVHIWLSVVAFQAAGAGDLLTGVGAMQWVTHSYAWMNFTIVALGCWTVGQTSIKENCIMLIISLVLGFIFDIVFIAIYDVFEIIGSCKSQACGEFMWSEVMAILNCLFKIATLIFAICEYMNRGGNLKVSVEVK